MVAEHDQFNLLASQADWAWPEALRNIFKPRGINLLVAQSAEDFVDIIEHQRIHTTIIDVDAVPSGGLATIRIIRITYPQLPCILLSRHAEQTLLDKALRLDVFSVIDKPVDMTVLQQQLNKLFIKKYNSHIFEV